MSDDEPTTPDPAEPSVPRTPDEPLPPAAPVPGQSAGRPAEGRDRLVAALKRPGSRGQLTVAVLLALLGFAAVTQVKANEQDDQFVGARQGDLIQYINNLSLASQRTETEIARLEQTRDSLKNDAESRRTAVDRAQQQANTLGILAGTVPAVGPGVRVTVTDEKGSVGSNQLLEGLQELRDAGAEAIELNNRVRVVAQTALQDAEGGVIVDGQLLKAPYVIEAIGGAHTLATALDFKGGFNDEVEGPPVNAKAETEELDRVEISTVVEPKPPKYAQPGGTG